MEFNTNHKTNELCILSNNIKYVQQNHYRYFIILDKEYLQILKFVNLYIIGKYKYIDFSKLNNDFSKLKILCKNLKYISFPYNIYSNIEININKSLKYLDILNIEEYLNIDYIKDCIGENLITIKSKYYIIEYFDFDYFDNPKYYNLKHKYIPILKSVIM